MILRTLNMDCTSYMLNFLSEVDVWKYQQAIPSAQEAQEAVNSYWIRKKIIVIEKISPEDSKILLNVLKLCLNLTEIRLEQINDIKELRNLPIVLSNSCNNIHTLVLNSVVLYKQNILRLCTFTKLRCLKFRCVANDDILAEVFLSIPTLEEVSITECKINITGNCLFALPKIIKKLELCRTIFLKSDLLTQAIREFDCLELLTVIHLDGPDFIAVPTLTSLEAYAIECNLNIITDCRQLKKLCLWSLNPIENDIIIRIVNNCSLLEVLEMGPLSFAVTTEELENLRNLPKLRQLRIQGEYFCTAGCPQYTECMSSLSKCKKLQLFSAKACGFNNFAALEIITHCSELTTIIIDNCNISPDLITRTAEELQNQTNRKSVLKMEIYTRLAVNFQELESTHPLLEVLLKESCIEHYC